MTGMNELGISPKRVGKFVQKMQCVRFVGNRTNFHSAGFIGGFNEGTRLVSWDDYLRCEQINEPPQCGDAGFSSLFSMN
jgi:hypothetical protein